LGVFIVAVWRSVAPAQYGCNCFFHLEVSLKAGGGHPLSQRCERFGVTHFFEERRLLNSSFCPPLRFKKGFESEPTLHSGINYAVLLLAAGHQFDTSFELRKVGE